MIDDGVCSPFPVHPFPLTPSLHPSLLSRQLTANICLVVYPGSMQSWMSATQEFFWSESMVSRMYSPPFSTCGGSQTLKSHTELHSVKGGRAYFPTTWFSCRIISETEAGAHVLMWSENGCGFYLKNKSVVFVGHLQRHGGPHLHDGCQRDAHFGLRGLKWECKRTQNKMSHLCLLCSVSLIWIDILESDETTSLIAYKVILDFVDFFRSPRGPKLKMFSACILQKRVTKLNVHYSLCGTVIFHMCRTPQMHSL